MYGIFGNFSATPTRRSIAPLIAEGGNRFSRSCVEREQAPVRCSREDSRRITGPSPAQYDTPRFGAPPFSRSYFQISSPVAGFSATMVRCAVDV